MRRYCVTVILVFCMTSPAFSFQKGFWSRTKWNALLIQNSTLFRSGYGGFGTVQMQDSDLNSIYTDGYMVMADFFFFRKRFSGRFEHGFDLYSRYTHKSFTTEEEIVSASGDVYREGEIHVTAFDIGARYLFGTVWLYELWQAYIVAAPRLVSFREEALNDDEENVGKTYYSVGFVGGIGIEITLLPYMGLFAEYNHGYTPVGDSDKNIEGHQFFYGVTVRTPH